MVGGYQVPELDPMGDANCRHGGRGVAQWELEEERAGAC